MAYTFEKGANGLLIYDFNTKVFQSFSNGDVAVVGNTVTIQNGDSVFLCMKDEIDNISPGDNLDLINQITAMFVTGSGGSGGTGSSSGSVSNYDGIISNIFKFNPSLDPTLKPNVWINERTDLITYINATVQNNNQTTGGGGIITINDLFVTNQNVIALGNDMVIDWGDGSNEVLNVAPVHEYVAKGTYKIKVNAPIYNTVFEFTICLVKNETANNDTYYFTVSTHNKGQILTQKYYELHDTDGNVFGVYTNAGYVYTPVFTWFTQEDILKVIGRVEKIDEHNYNNIRVKQLNEESYVVPAFTAHKIIITTNGGIAHMHVGAETIELMGGIPYVLEFSGTNADDIVVDTTTFGIKASLVIIY